MTVASAKIGDAASVINAGGDVGAYGRVHVTLAAKSVARVVALHRIVTRPGSSPLTGRWQWRVITMCHVLQLADGTLNLDVVTFTPLSTESIVSASVLE